MGLRVIHPGLGTTVQDEGRVGYLEWGVPVAGAFDRHSAALANALVGNQGGCAVLELTLFGGWYAAEAPLALAIAGAPMAVATVSGTGPRRELAVPQSFPLAQGERLILGGLPSGARCYLAVRRGWRTPLIMGSRSREQPVQAGDLLPAEPGTTLIRRPSETSWPDPLAASLRLIDGPDACPNFAGGFWESQVFQVGPETDRMGIRLECAHIPEFRQPERVSAPVAPGAVQVAGTQLIVLGVASGTMGGYPHVAHVISADLDRVGQLRAGDAVRFRRVTLAEARALDFQERSARERRLRIIAAASKGDTIPGLSLPVLG